MNNKLESYVGFAIRAGLVAIGMDNIKPNAEVCLLSQNLAENSKDKIKNLKNLKVFEIEQSVLDKMLNEGVKVISIKRSELSKAIIKLLEEK